MNTIVKFNIDTGEEIARYDDLTASADANCIAEHNLAGSIQDGECHYHGEGYTFADRFVE